VTKTPDIKMQVTPEMIAQCVAQLMAEHPGKKLEDIPDGELTKLIVDAVLDSAQFVN
jgi:hypothetical protein